MKLFTKVATALEEEIESMEKRIDRYKERIREGEVEVMYRGERVTIDEAIRDLEQRIEANERLNE